MSVRVQIDARAFERLLRTPGGLGEQLLRRRAEPVAARARRLAPGSMGRGIQMTVSGRGRGMAAVITSTHPASRYVIEGTRPHVIRPRRKKALRFTVGGRTVYAKRVQHPGNRPNNFLLEALRDAL